MSASPSKYPFYKLIPEAEKERIFQKFNSAGKTIDQLITETGLSKWHINKILNEKLQIGYGRKLENK